MCCIFRNLSDSLLEYYDNLCATKTTLQFYNSPIPLNLPPPLALNPIGNMAEAIQHGKFVFDKISPQPTRRRDKIDNVLDCSDQFAL